MTGCTSRLPLHTQGAVASGAAAGGSKWQRQTRKQPQAMLRDLMQQVAALVQMN